MSSAKTARRSWKKSTLMAWQCAEMHLSVGGRRRLLGSFFTMLKRISKSDLAHAVKLFSLTALG